MKIPAFFRRIICGSAVFVMAAGCASLPPILAEKRENIEYALDSGVLSPFEIPFSSFVELEMWDALDDAFAEGRKYRKVQKIPLKHPGRPLVLHDRICFFPDRPGKKGAFFCSHPESLKPSALDLPGAYPAFGGGIRCAGNGWLGWTGADGAMDAAVIYHPETGRKRILTIGEGHYIVSMEMKHGFLLMGTCGGTLNVWRLQNFAFIGAFLARPSPVTDWKTFNRLPCLTAVHGDGEKFAAGSETRIFLWKGDRRKPSKIWKRRLPHGFVRFHQDFFIEYQDRRICLRDLNTGRKIHETTVNSPISDIAITDDTALPSRTGPLLVVSLKHGKGLRIYDFPSLQLLRSSDFPAESVAVFQNRIYTASVNALIRYDFTADPSQRYEMFIKDIRFHELALNEKQYHALVKLAYRYPEQLDINVLGHQYLTRHRIKLGYRLETAPASASGIPESKKRKKTKSDKQEYRFIFEVINSSEKGVFVNIHFRWFRDEKWRKASKKTIALFIPPGGGAGGQRRFFCGNIVTDRYTDLSGSDSERRSGLLFRTGSGTEGRGGGTVSDGRLSEGRTGPFLASSA